MTPQTTQPEAHIGKFFWLKWVLANAVGFGVATAVSFEPFGADTWSMVAATREGVVGIVGGILLWVSAIFGALAIGAAQWLFLRRRVRWASSWFLATSLGWLASHLIVHYLVVRPATVTWSLFWSAKGGVLPVVLVAVPQWIILRRHVMGAGWWMVASLAGAAGGFVGFLAGAFGAVVVAFFLVDFIDELWFSAILAGLIWAPMGAAIGGITGVALKQLLQRSIPETPSPPPATIPAD